MITKAARATFPVTLSVDFTSWSARLGEGGSPAFEDTGGIDALDLRKAMGHDLDEIELLGVGEMGDFPSLRRRIMRFALIGNLP